jgi:hypothetical protein
MKFCYLLLIASLVNSLQPFSFPNWVTNFGHFYQNDCKYLCPMITRNPDQNDYNLSLQEYIKCLYKKAYKITVKQWERTGQLFDRSFDQAVIKKALEYNGRDSCIQLSEQNFTFLFAPAGSQTPHKQLPISQAAQQPVSEDAILKSSLSLGEKILSLYNFNHYVYKGQCKKKYDVSLITKFNDNHEYFKCLLGFVYCWHPALKPKMNVYDKEKRIKIITKIINFYWSSDRGLSNFIKPYTFVQDQEIKSLEEELQRKKLEFDCNEKVWQTSNTQNTL